MEKATISELVKQLEAELIRKGYKESTLNYYRTNWKRILEHFEKQGESYFSESLAMEYVDSKCDFFAKEKAGLLTQNDIYLFRIVRMMGDFQQHGTILRRYNKSLSRINEPTHIQVLNLFFEDCQACGYAISTQKGYKRTAENFLSFMESKKLTFEKLTGKELTDFTMTLMGYSYKMVEFVLCGLRAFLHFLHKKEYLEDDISGLLPHLQVRKQTQIPSIWKHEDIVKLLEVIDCGNPSGKRDYAMILLVTRLGLRSIDVKQLMFEQINWNENYIEIVQSKTTEPVRLPLLKDVGWAIIDYLKHGRPISDSPYIFLRHLAPIEPFSYEDHLGQIIVKYMRLAKLPISKKKKVGMHSLRHTLATALMEQHIPIEEIADILGHQDTESTSVYLKSSLELLRECSLNPEVE